MFTTDMERSTCVNAVAGDKKIRAKVHQSISDELSS